MKIKVDNIKQNKGFTTADIVVAIALIMIFVGIIASVFYNYYLTTTSRNRNAIATNCLVDVIEHFKKMNYEDVTNESISSELDKMKADGTIPSGYKVNVSFQKYNELPGNEKKQDIIKILTTNIQYTVGNKTEKIEIKTLITKNIF